MQWGAFKTKRIEMTAKEELARIQDLLDDAKITQEPFCGNGSVAGRVEWVLKRNAIIEARCKEWAEKYNYMESERNFLFSRIGINEPPPQTRAPKNYPLT